MKTKRNIVHIDEEKCNGCGLCVPSCAEGALQIIDGKAKLVSEVYCDGLGACLGECPQGAISIEERIAEEFDEEATKEFLESGSDECAGTCAAANLARFLEDRKPAHTEKDYSPVQSMLGHWPVQLTLVPPNAPFLQNADLVIAADCTGFAYPAFHRDFLQGKALVTACPKLDNAQAHFEKLVQIFRQSTIKSVQVVRMEVPCCSGLLHLTREAVKHSGKDIPVEEIVISVKGEILSAV